MRSSYRFPIFLTSSLIALALLAYGLTNLHPVRGEPNYPTVTSGAVAGGAVAGSQITPPPTGDAGLAAP